MKKNYFLMSLFLMFLGYNANSQLTAPFTESFNSTTIPATWSQSATTGGPWVVAGTLGYAGSTILDHTGTAGSSRAWMDFSGSDAGVILMSDTIDVSALTIPELNFWYNNNEGSNGVNPYNTLYVEVYNGTAWVGVDTLQQDNAGVWSEHFYNLLAYVLPGNKLLVRFRAEPGATISGSAFYQDLAIDDISVRQYSLCRVPVTLFADNITDNSAIARWSAGPSADTAWTVQYDLSGFAIGTGTSTTVQVDSLILSGLADYTFYDFYVRGYCTSGDTSAWAGPFTFQTLPTCVEPDSLEAFNLSDTSAYLNWKAGNGANLDTAWSVLYGAQGFSPTAGGTYIHTNTDSLYISGLTAVTPYDFYVRGYCNNGDTSFWVGPYTFTTTCGIFVPTYSEDFTSMAFSVAPNCWEEGSGLLTVNSTIVKGSSLWGSDDFANVSGGSNAAYINIYTTNRSEWLISPSIDLGNGSVPYQVEFDIALTDYAGARVTDNGTLGLDDKVVLLISTDNGNTWSDTNILRQWDSTDIPSFTGEYYYYNLTNAGYTGVVKLAFYAESTVSNEDTDLTIDNFAVRYVPTCPRPLNLVTTSIYADSVNLTWDTASTDSTYILEYGTPGFALGTGTTVSSVSDSAFINGLTANTTYEVYVRSFCDVSDTSLWTGPLVFTTPCSSFAAPYMQDFATITGTVMPSCWEEGQGLLTVNSSISLGSSNWGSDNFANVAGASNAAYINIYSTNRNGWLISPTINIGNGSVAYQVEFDIALTDFAGARATDNGTLGLDDKVALIISTDNGNTWSDTNILRLWDSTDIPSFQGEYFYYDLTAAGYTGDIKLALYAESTVSNEDSDLSVDNFNVVQVPTCPRPINLVFDSATQTAANISWTNGSADVSWVLEYGTPGFTQGTGTIVASATNPAVVSGLTASTCYDVYLKSVCTAGDSSLWIGPIRFCTECAPVVDLCEDFEGYSAGELALCWESFIISTGTSTVGISTFGGNTAPNAVELDAGSDGGATMFLISPEMTALTAGTHRASFWAEGSFNPDTVLIIGTISDPTDPATFTPWDTIKTISSSYQFFKIPFDTYTGTDTRIAFQYIATASFRDITIDDFCFELIPSCEKAPFPTVLNDGVDSTTLNLGWNNDPTHTSFIINHGPTGYDPVTNPTGGVTGTSSFNFYSATGLNSLSEYCFWIKSICVNGDTSAWAGPYCGKTGCPSGVSLPYFEDFTDYRSVFPLDETPQCWEEALGGLTASGSVGPAESQWEPDGFANVGTTGAARINFSAFGTREAWLLTPRFNLGTDAGTPRFIEFDIALTEDFSTNAATNGFGVDDTIAFVVSYDGGVTWKNTDVLMQWDTANEPGATSTHVTYTLRNAVGNVRFGFYGKSSIGNEGVDFFVDNFSIKDTLFLGVDEIAEVASFKVFPNPNNGEFTVLNKGNANKSNVKVVDIQGRVVYEDAYYFNENARKQIDLRDLNAGVYILILQSEGKQEQHRIILNK